VEQWVREAARKRQQLIKGIVIFPSLLSWLQISGPDIHQERSTTISSSANTDIAQLDSEQFNSFFMCSFNFSISL
jgi:hypothetical protein